MPNESSDSRPTSVLFVCLGNICRSPMAEGVFRHLLVESGSEDLFDVDSGGTGAWHVGEPPDARGTATAARHGVTLGGRARQVTPDDLDRFDWIIAMDRENLHALERMGAPRGELRLLREFDDEGVGDVPDPYYGGPDGFETVYRMVLRSCAALLRHIESDAAAD